MYLLNGFLIFCLLLFCPLDGSAKMYKWVDKNGNIHLSSQKPDEYKEEGIGKGWAAVLNFPGVEKIAKSGAFQLQGTDAVILWEVVSSKEEKKFLDKDAELRKKEIEHTKIEIKHTEKDHTKAKKMLEEAKKGSEDEQEKEKQLIKVERVRVSLKNKLLSLEKKITSLNEEKKAVSLKVTIKDNSGTFREPILDTRKNRGRQTIRGIEAGNYYLEVTASLDCYWKIEILEKQGKALTKEDNENKSMVSESSKKDELSVSESGSEKVKVEGVKINKTKSSKLWGVIGQIRNLGNSPIKGYVTIKFLNSTGDIVKTDSRTVNGGDPIKPGQAAPFECWRDRGDFNGVVDFQIIFKEGQ